GAERGEQARELGAPHRIEIAELTRDRRAAHPLHDRRVAELPLDRVGAGARDRRAGALALARDLVGEARLADTRLPDQAGDARPVGVDRTPGREQAIALAVAPDQAPRARLARGVVARLDQRAVERAGL